MPNHTGYILTSYTVAGTVIGAVLGVAFIPLAKYGPWQDAFSLLTVTGHGAGWLFGLGKVLLERRGSYFGR